MDNCQVAVFGVLSDGQGHALVDMRLYLPKNWIDDTARCERAGVPAEARTLTSKSEHALDLVKAARARGMRFAWVGVDAGYGKEPAFLRALDEAGEVFVADVHRTQRVWTERPVLEVPEAKPGRGRPPTRLVSETPAITVESLVAGLPAQSWERCRLREGTRGPVRVDVDIAHRRVWLWDGEEEAPRCWHLIVRREVGSPKTIKYTLSNAPAKTPVSRLAPMQGQRDWVERTFEDAKGECGLADDQALNWRSWHHHVTMVMLAMQFIAEQRAIHQPSLDLLTPRDIVDMLKRDLAPKAGRQ